MRKAVLIKTSYNFTVWIKRANLPNGFMASIQTKVTWKIISILCILPSGLHI